MIEVRIPYKEDDLAGAYNRAMKSADSNWVLILDHDVFLATNKYWYQIINKVVNNLDNKDKVGLISCVTSGTPKHRPQRPDINKDTSNIKTHVNIAKKLYKKYGTEIKEAKTKKLGGAFMLLNKDVWKEIKFRNVGRGIKFIDWDYNKRLLNNGYKIYVIPGLYVYHGKQEKNLIDK